jgi:hypothetical protein
VWARALFSSRRVRAISRRRRQLDVTLLIVLPSFLRYRSLSYTLSKAGAAADIPKKPSST